MNAQEIIRYIAESEKRTPVKLFIREKRPLDYGSARVFGTGDRIVFGEWAELKKLLEAQKDDIEDVIIESGCRNSAVPMLDFKNLAARIEPGALIREHVEIGKNAVIMMGAILNIGAVVGEESLIDMGAVLGGRAVVGKRCHIGAGAVLAGVIEPASAVPVIIEDGVFIGANAVIAEGVRVGKNAVVAAGAVVLEDVPPETVAAGVPARIIKRKDNQTASKTEAIDLLRSL